MFCLSVVRVVEEHSLPGQPDPPGGQLQPSHGVSTAELQRQGGAAEVGLTLAFTRSFSFHITCLVN